jgi:DNA primase
LLFIETLKARMDIVAVVRDRGFPLVIREKGALIRRPFHSYPRPVLYLSQTTGVWQCFDCRKSGDVIRFIPRAPWEAPR